MQSDTVESIVSDRWRDIARRRLVWALRERQYELGLTDVQMATRLGVSQPLWSSLVARKRNVTLRFIQLAVTAFPDLEPLAYAIVSADSR